MPQFRKKPVVIEATQWNGKYDDKLRIEALFPSMQTMRCEYHVEQNAVSLWSIGTLEGRHDVTPGDFIIRGVAGEFYPCKPSIFAATYEAVDA